MTKFKLEIDQKSTNESGKLVTYFVSGHLVCGANIPQRFSLCVDKETFDAIETGISYAIPLLGK